jgi:hypothetical protein
MTKDPETGALKYDAAERRKRGCEAEATDADYWMIDSDTGVILKRCPLALITYQSITALHSYNLLQSQIMPEPGGFLAQSSAYWRVMGLVARLKEQTEKREPDEVEGP